MERILFIVISLLLFQLCFTGCAGISFMEMQDADTLGDGNSSFGLSTSMGLSTVELFLDSTQEQVYERTSWAPIELHFRTGITENLDCGISFWNSSLLSVFRFRNKTSYNDIGMNVNFKFRVTDSLSKRNVAFTLAFLGQLAEYRKVHDYWNYHTYGIVPGIVYSKTVRGYETSKNSTMYNTLARWVKSLYAGFKAYFLFTDIKSFTVSKPFEIQIQDTPILFDPYLGISAGYNQNSYFEMHGIFFKNPYYKKIEFVPFIGIGTRFTF